MKKLTLLVFIVLLCSNCIISLEEEGLYYATITYTGRLLDKMSFQPISGIVIQITNGTIIHAKTRTSEDGIFQLSVILEDINSDYYLLISGHAEYPQKKEKLVGFGKNGYNYGDILLADYNSSLPRFQHDGITYIAHPDLGVMNWYQAIDICNYLTYGNYSDWVLPSKEILFTMYIYKNEIGDFSSDEYGSSYWSCSEYGYSNRVSCLRFYDGKWFDEEKGYWSRVRCVRKAS